MPRTTVTVHQPHYLPYPGLLDKVDRADLVIWMDNAAFSRGGWQNRNRVKTRTGPLTLTAPVAKALSPTAQIRDALLNPTARWQPAHEKTIRQAYARAAHLADCEPLLRALYHRKWLTLGEVADTCCSVMMKLFGITTPSVRASTLGPVTATKSARLVELCQRVGADTYLAGDGSRCYLDEKVFAEAGITIRWQGYQSPRYSQLHTRVGFVPDLSALDLLANTGPRAVDVLRSARSTDLTGALS